MIKYEKPTIETFKHYHLYQVMTAEILIHEYLEDSTSSLIDVIHIDTWKAVKPSWFVIEEKCFLLYADYFLKLFL